MTRPLKPELENRLSAHFATIRSSSSLGDALKRSAENWWIYAAVTGSALAMATNASASVIYSGPLDITAAITPVSGSGGGATSAVKNIELKNALGVGINRTFQIGVRQGIFPGSFSIGTAAATNLASKRQDRFGFLKTGSASGPVKKLASGARISNGVPGRFSTKPLGFLAFSLTSSGFVRFNHTEWPKDSKGFAGFSFKTGGGKTDYGWIQLEYTVGPNNRPDSITAFGWAYDNAGDPILAGQETSAVPEPSTFALTLLAAGAVGVEALRRRRKAAA